MKYVIENAVYIIKVLGIWSPLLAIPIYFIIARRLCWFSGFRGIEMFSLPGKIEKYKLNPWLDALYLIIASVMFYGSYKLLHNSQVIYYLLALYITSAFYLVSTLSAKALIYEVTVLGEKVVTKPQKWYYNVK